MAKLLRKRTVGQSLFSLMSNWLKSNRHSDRTVVFFAHRHADPDALCAAFGLSQLLSKISVSRLGHRGHNGLSIRIISPQGASLLGANVCKALAINFEEEIQSSDIEKSDLIFAVDVGDNELLEPFLQDIKTSKARKILVDHHGIKDAQMQKFNEDDKGVFEARLVDPVATSTCEIVAHAFPEKLLDKRTSVVLLVGLLFDSQHLGLATLATLEAALKLVSAGARIEDAKELLRSRPDRSEIIARMKSAQRLKFVEVGRYIIAQSEVSSFQASVARMLIDVGADVGVALGEHEKEARISVRSTQRFFRETGINMGSELAKLSHELGLVGGGHSTAASISGKKPPSEIVERLISSLQTLIP